jgi:hypothetical protein
MAVYLPIDDRPGGPVEGLRETLQTGLANRQAVCFLCGSELSWDHPMVYWWGQDGRVILTSAECASRLGLHLAGDAREAELASAIRGSRLRSRLAAVMRQSLEVATAAMG